MLTPVSPQLDKDALSILKYSLPCKCKIKCNIYSTENEQISVNITHINSFSVIQQFEIECLDLVTLSVQLSIDDLLVLLRNYKDLHCSLTLTRVHPAYFFPISDLEPLTYDYLVLINNAEDILKTIPKADLTSAQNQTTSISETQERIIGRKMELTIQLRSKNERDLRLEKPNATLNKVTIQDTMTFIANMFNIKNSIITPSENTKIYDTLIIPPQQTFMTIFDYLQTSYGVYPKGIEYYYTNDVLYVYPGLETNPSTDNGKKILHIYKLPKDNYSGNDGYYAYDNDDNIHLLMNQDITISNNTEKSTELAGNNIITRQPDTAIDIHRTINPDGTGKFNDDRVLQVGLDNNKTASENTTNTIYTSETNNMLELASNLARNNSVQAECGWTLAMPYLFQPGMKVIFHYDDINEYKTVTGILSAVQCTLSILEQQDEIIYAGSGQLSFRLEPMEQKDNLLESTPNDKFPSASLSSKSKNTGLSSISDTINNFKSSIKSVTELKDSTIQSVKSSTNTIIKNIREQPKSLVSRIKSIKL